MLVGGFVRLNETASLLLHEWNTFGFFLGLMVISAFAEEAGIFEALANAAARWGRGSAKKLYLAVFAVGTVISVFLTNDSTALILTPDWSAQRTCFFKTLKGKELMGFISLETRSYLCRDSGSLLRQSKATNPLSKACAARKRVVEIDLSLKAVPSSGCKCRSVFSLQLIGL